MILNPKLDLVLERVVDVPPDLVWAAWTQPEHVKKWFCPLPWTTVECEIDLRPGGIFRTVMCSPDGERFPNVGCFLEIVPERKLLWTDALEAGYRPTTQPLRANCPFWFTACISLEPAGNGTRYRAVVMHSDEASRKQHEEMGFAEGWSVAVDQLVAHVKTGAVRP